MNYKLEKFWNINFANTSSTISAMNYKLEKFWNHSTLSAHKSQIVMNYKLEKFWNKVSAKTVFIKALWTINLKSFEICLSQLSV